MYKLFVYPKTRNGIQDIEQAIEQSPYHGEWDAYIGAFTFEEDEEMLDSLENDLSVLFEDNDIRALFEIAM